MTQSVEYLHRYHDINNSFKRKLIFRFGGDAGFFSEYNNMLIAILFCLDQGIEFSIYSKYSTFSAHNGWNDYFEPFCKEEGCILNKKYNYREGDSRIINLYSVINRKLGLPFVTQQLWPKIRTHRLPSYNYHDFFESQNTIRENLSSINKMIWKYNKNTKNEIDNIKHSISLKNPYIGMHIRAGDKFVEHPLFEIDKYINKAKKISRINEIFLLTDDYRIYLSLKETHPEYNVVTICPPEQNGYFHKQFIDSSSDNIRKAIYSLFASMDILEHSEYFIGTFSSNVGMNIGLRKSDSQCIGVDSSEWFII